MTRGDMPADDIHVAILIAHSPGGGGPELEAFVRRLGSDVAPALVTETGVQWHFHSEEATRLGTDEPRAPSDFLDEASLRMVEGPYDAAVVVTDVALVSRSQRVVPGLVSPAARCAVLSTRKLRVSPRGSPPRALDSEAVRWNAGALLLHLIGHALGLRHTPSREGGAMAPFAIEQDRRELPRFGAASQKRIRSRAAAFPERKDVDQGMWSELAFHVSSGLRHAPTVIRSLVRSRAPLLPLRLPRLTTAAVAPAFILVFTAEIWDAGFHMTAWEVWLFAGLSIAGSAAYLSVAQNLFLPHKEKRLHTEHLAVVNVITVLVMLLAIAGLFVMVSLLMLLVQLFIFPPDLIREWPSLDLQAARIGLPDQVRIAGLISTIGVLTGALAGGLESREVLRHLALFERDP